MCSSPSSSESRGAILARRTREPGGRAGCWSTMMRTCRASSRRCLRARPSARACRVRRRRMRGRRRRRERVTAGRAVLPTTRGVGPDRLFATSTRGRQRARPRSAQQPLHDRRLPGPRSPKSTARDWRAGRARIGRIAHQFGDRALDAEQVRRRSDAPASPRSGTQSGRPSVRASQRNAVQRAARARLESRAGAPLEPAFSQLEHAIDAGDQLRKAPHFPESSARVAPTRRAWKRAAPTAGC